MMAHSFQLNKRNMPNREKISKINIFPSGEGHYPKMGQNYVKTTFMPWSDESKMVKIPNFLYNNNISGPILTYDS